MLRYAAPFILSAVLLAAGCSDDKTPIRIGLIAGISGGNADLGQAGRNGALLAVEDINRSGGIRGRPLELVVRDDGNSREKAAAATQDLINEKVAVVVGPYTTAMAEAVLTVAEPAKLLIFSPSASAIQFSGKDDHFFRLCATTTDNAENYAEFIGRRRGYHRVSIVLDANNATFAGNFLDAFRKNFASLGGEIALELWQDFRSGAGYASLVSQLLAPRPDLVFLIANAVDVARVAQQVRNVDTAIPLMAVEWAGTQQLIELGGRAVDGLEVLQLFNRFGKEDAYVRFSEAYQRQFGAPPSSQSVQTYDVMLTLKRALEQRKSGEGVKQALLKYGPYDGLQQQFALDPYGDSRRQNYFVRIQGAEFVAAP